MSEPIPRYRMPSSEDGWEDRYWLQRRFAKGLRVMCAAWLGIVSPATAWLLLPEPIDAIRPATGLTLFVVMLVYGWLYLRQRAMVAELRADRELADQQVRMLMRQLATDTNNSES